LSRTWSYGDATTALTGAAASIPQQINVAHRLGSAARFWRSARGGFSSPQRRSVSPAGGPAPIAAPPVASCMDEAQHCSESDALPLRPSFTTDPVPTVPVWQRAPCRARDRPNEEGQECVPSS
jgi:hypothetical protein